MSTAGLGDLDQRVAFFPGMGPGRAMYGNLEIHSQSSYMIQVDLAPPHRGGPGSEPHGVIKSGLLVWL